MYVHIHLFPYSDEFRYGGLIDDIYANQAIKRASFSLHLAIMEIQNSINGESIVDVDTISSNSMACCLVRITNTVYENNVRILPLENNSQEGYTTPQKRYINQLAITPRSPFNKTRCPDPFYYIPPIQTKPNQTKPINTPQS